MAVPYAETVRWDSTRRSHWVRTMGTFKTYVCGSSTKAMHGSPRGSVIFSSRRDAMRLAIYLEMHGSYQSHYTGDGGGGEVTTKPKH